MNDIIFIVIIWVLIGLFSFWQRKMRSKAKEAKSHTTTTAPPVKKESELKRILREKFDIEIPEPPEPNLRRPPKAIVPPWRRIRHFREPLWLSTIPVPCCELISA